MKWLIRIVLAVVAVFALIMISQQIASETGEVVVLTTIDQQGAEHTTRLWVVEHDGAQWLRSGADAMGWYQRLAANSAVHLARGETEQPYAAVPQADKRAVINGLMREKYGWRDRYIELLFGRDDAIPIRLDPIIEAPAALDPGAPLDDGDQNQPDQ